jgi:DNA-binding winged helix-turn-helix (wHTH) protein
MEGILIADWRVEPALLRITHNGDSLKLEPKVMAVLVYLARRPGQVVTREELEDSVWAGAIVSYDALTGAIQKLRKAFNDDPRRPRIIETLSKKGYRLVVPVQPLDAQAGVNLSATAAIPVKGHRPWAIISNRSISLNENLPVAYFVTGLAYRELGEYVMALVEAEKAIEYDPNYANAHLLLATLLYHAGRPEEALERVRKAMLINPHHPYMYTFHLGQALYILGRYDEAVAAFEKGIASNPASQRLHVWMAAAYAQAGDIEGAEWEVDQILTMNPEFSLQRIEGTFPFKDPADRERIMEGLRKAGLS